ncbi:hypothetical protein GCM10020331_076300 [Ectobacillus funiculus]
MTIQIRNVSKQYGEFQALTDIELDIPKGGACCVIRPFWLRQDDAAADYCWFRSSGYRVCFI